MKKAQIILYTAVVLILAHIILVAGCGRNPLISAINGGTNVNVGVGRL